LYLGTYPNKFKNPKVSIKTPKKGYFKNTKTIPPKNEIAKTHETMKRWKNIQLNQKGIFERERERERVLTSSQFIPSRKEIKSFTWSDD